ncbi:MAG: MoaD/ThiS family protein [candidate division NC10 bacterium]|nr:MoaD/ThiS family protein [candidate division NC10 bacterium]
MSVRVRLAFPYRKLVGRDEVELDLDSPAKVREILKMVAERYPGFKEYADKGTDEQISTHMVVLLQDKVLRMEDVVESGATLQVMAPIAGGSGTEPDSA